MIHPNWTRAIARLHLVAMRKFIVMPDDSRTDSNLWIPFMWISIGFVSWYLSKFLFSYILSPMLIDAVRTTNANTQSAFLMTVVNMLYADMAGFALCFSFAAWLSYFTQSTKLRLLLFVVGAIAINLYVQVEGLAGNMRMYPELPSWAITSEMQGFISLLLITPLCSIAGSKIGTWIKMKKKGLTTRSKRPAPRLEMSETK